MATKHDPVLTTFFLCDQLIRDEIAQKWGALGLYNTLYVPGFPVTFDRLWWFVRIADAPPLIDMKVQLFSPGGILLSERPGRFERSSTPQGGPLPNWWEIGGTLQTPTFSAAGTYRVVCSVEGVDLGETSLHLVERKMTPQAT